MDVLSKVRMDLGAERWRWCNTDSVRDQMQEAPVGVFGLGCCVVFVQQRRVVVSVEGANCGWRCWFPCVMFSISPCLPLEFLSVFCCTTFDFLVWLLSQTVYLEWGIPSCFCCVYFSLLSWLWLSYLAVFTTAWDQIALYPFIFMCESVESVFHSSVWRGGSRVYTKTSSGIGWFGFGWAGWVYLQ